MTAVTYDCIFGTVGRPRTRGGGGGGVSLLASLDRSYFHIITVYAQLSLRVYIGMLYLGKILAWSLFGAPFFGAQQYCIVDVNVMIT